MAVFNLAGLSTFSGNQYSNNTEAAENCYQVWAMVPVVISESPISAYAYILVSCSENFPPLRQSVQPCCCSELIEA